MLDEPEPRIGTDAGSYRDKSGAAVSGERRKTSAMCAEKAKTVTPPSRCGRGRTP